MAGKDQEISRQQRPDAHAQEPQLPQSEVVKAASELIKDYRQALRQTPEFMHELVELYFSRTNPTVAPQTHFIFFDRGNYSYHFDRTRQSVQDNDGNLETSLQISKFSKNDKSPHSEVVSIEILDKLGSRSERLSGKISHIERKGGKTYKNTNTPSAIEKAKNFLASSLGSSRQQKEISINDLEIQEVDVPSEETLLTPVERGGYALKLINDYRKLIGQAPEFQQRLAEIFFGHHYNDYNAFSHPFQFKKGEHIYELYHNIDAKGGVISIAQEGIQKEKHPTTYVTIEAEGNYYYKDRQFKENESYSHIRFNENRAGQHVLERGEFAIDSPTAISKTRAFLISNLGI